MLSHYDTFIGLSEFESETSCPPDKHANQLRYSPLLIDESISYLKKCCKYLSNVLLRLIIDYAIPPPTISWFMKAKCR